MLAEIILAASASFVVYTFVGYPALLAALGAISRRNPMPDHDIGETTADLPLLSITVPAYNEEAQIAPTLDALLASRYPRERMQILVVSDASTDRTDGIVESYADQGVELLRMPQRMGKTAAENGARPLLRGTIILNTDASVRLHPDAAPRLVRALADPEVGVASGRDISVARAGDDANKGESSYVGYEMGVRRLETKVGGIVGASGCLYAVRRELHAKPLPAGLSRDFGSALIARENGFRAVSVDEALCFVPRTASLHREFARKVRTVSRGLGTLLHKRQLMNPFRYGLFAWMLVSHKLCRWLLPFAFLAGLAACVALAPSRPWALFASAAAGTTLLLAWLGWTRAEHQPLPRSLALPSYFVIGNLATVLAWVRVFSGRVDAVWEPTRRDAVDVRIS